MSRAWTTKEIRFIQENAGRMSSEQLARQLKRSQKSVQQQASRKNVSLRHYSRVKLVWCRECCSWRARLDHNELCRVCRSKRLLDEKEKKFDVLLATAPESLRISQTSRVNERGTRKFDRHPHAADTVGRSNYHKTKAEIQYAVAVEEWEWKRVHRKVLAVQKRLERLRKHLARLSEE